MNRPAEGPMAAVGPTPPGTALPAAHAPAVGAPHPHESAHLHVAGAAPYTDDLPELAGTLHAALGLSPLAHGVVEAIDLDRIRALPGVVDVFGPEAIPGFNDCGPLLHDEPILAGGSSATGAAALAGAGGAVGAGAVASVGSVGATLRYVGQPVFAVVATTRAAARRAAALARDVITARPLPPVLTALQAHAAGAHVVPSMHLARGDAAAAIATAPHRLQLRFAIGGQEHFYLEGQVAYALPGEGDAVAVHCSTQHPSEMQHLLARALGVASHAVQVTCRRMGGGFGGKESQSALFACVAAVAAVRLRAPVKLRVDRDDDFMITGRRHGFDYELDAGHDDAGRIAGVAATLVSNAGHSADLSGPVMTRALCHFDNAYFLPHVALHGHSARTNTQSNTAFRGFGGPQGAFAVEMLLDSIARRLGIDALDVRRANLYGGPGRDTAPYGQVIDDDLGPALIEELAASSGYARRRADIATYNAASPVLKKGLALTPVKFGIAFNVSHLNQAGALVHVYTDGSVLVNHGGTEMGQGLNTKVAQVVAHELGLPLARVRCTATDTHKVPNTSATAASTGSDLNGMAALDAARQVRQRLAAFAAGRWGGEAQGVRFEGGCVDVGGDRVPFEEVVTAAYFARVQLWSDGYYATPGLHWDRQAMQGHPFHYYAWGAAVSEVVVDTLTGEWKLARVDIVHDVGRSLNPAIDIGQIEGGFMQGMGWLTMEELVWHPQTGALATHAPSTYKIPTAGDCPADFRVRLFDRPNAQDTVHRSKAVGEPPLLLAFSVFFAIRDAVSAAGGHRTDPPLQAPATCEAILRAVQAVASASTTAGVP